MTRLKILLLLTIAMITLTNTIESLPDGFVYINDIDPTIRVNLKYIGRDNFVGKGFRIPGYNANKGILTKQAALALKEAQALFNKQGYCIIIYDAYRPQRTVNFFVNWVLYDNLESNKKYFYPREEKKTFLDQGYIAQKSGHSRGSTVDLSIIECDRNHLPQSTPIIRDFNKGIQLPFMFDNSIDTGTGFDLFDQASHVDNDIVSDVHKANRQIIIDVMKQAGFTVLPQEWWHYTLDNEPLKEYYDFEIE